MTAMDVDRYSATRAAYVHVPFCSEVCPYCDFAVVAGADHLAERYVDAVIAEIGISDPWGPVESVYFGGGTPSQIAPSLLGRVLDALARQHGLAGGAEISLEVNPEDFGAARANELRSIGFNRVSFGAQSFDDAVLAELGRRHRSAEIVQSVDHARRAGFSNLSLDLIFGSPVETDQSWESTLDSALSTQPDHISCYALTVEPGTPPESPGEGGQGGPGS